MKRNYMIGAIAIVLVGTLTCSAYFLGRQSGIETPPATPVETALVEQPLAVANASEPKQSEPMLVVSSEPTPQFTPEPTPVMDLAVMFPAESAQPAPEATASKAVSRPEAAEVPTNPVAAASLSAGPQDVPDGVISFDAGYSGNGTPTRPDPPVSSSSGKKSGPVAAEADWGTEAGDETETANESSGSFDYDLESFAAEVLRLTNQARAEVGAAALETDPVLSEMAQARMDENNGKMVHIRPDGTTPDTIFAEYNTALTCTGEIIMSTARSPKAVVDGFLSSSSHRKNLLNSDHEYVGIGVAWGDTPAGPGIAVLELFAK